MRIEAVELVARKIDPPGLAMPLTSPLDVLWGLRRLTSIMSNKNLSKRLIFNNIQKRKKNYLSEIIIYRKSGFHPILPQ